MARLIGGLVGGVLLASVTFGVAAAGSELCLADDRTSGPCPLAGDAVVEPSLATAPTAPTDSLGVDPVPAVTTSTLGPPTVVQPFAGVAVSAAQADEVAPALIQPAEQQKLPPGPPSRVP